MTGIPEPNEYAPFYAEYVSRSAMEQDIVTALQKQIEETAELVRKVAPEKTTEHIDGKWSLRETLGHLCDTERVFGYRAWRFAHNDKMELAGFEQDDYVREGWNNYREIDDLLGELSSLRAANASLFRRITPEIGLRGGIANGKYVSVRALLYITLGHERRHLEIIRERYGV